MMNDDFAYLVLAIVEEIPYGKVSSYGAIADMAGYPRNSRLVAKVLSNASLYGEYPCHRVVNSAGRTAPGWDEQISLLDDEGVTFKKNGNVDMKLHEWKG